MKFIADLHLHSKYSRATAKNLDLENLYRAALIKGVSLVGTGDFTHPAWMEELESKLVEAEPGFFSLKKEIAKEIEANVPPSCSGEVRFVLQAEISSIYKRDGRVRKNHNLIYFPDLMTAKLFNAKLDALGNIKSDGRPILGLDARDLMEIMLETNDQGFLVPAHIWTPWFSMFGSKSGFNTIEECFGDLAPHIFACETGLSSDPPMNWRVKNLDQISLISNSDAHSPGFLGRNASVFNTDFSYPGLRCALETQDTEAFLGTLDMYPDQGKYHYDGHRKCNVSLNPDDTVKLGGVCPECKKPLTLGVLHRVGELADRPEGYQAENRPGYSHVVPLVDVLSEIFQVGPRTKKVAEYYRKAIEALGPELGILTDSSFEDMEKSGVPKLPEAIRKMRSNDMHISPGFDGEFGKVKLFSQEERDELKGEKHLLFARPKTGKKTVKNAEIPADFPRDLPSGDKPCTAGLAGQKNQEPDQHALGGYDVCKGLNPGQMAAVVSDNPAVLIQAGPGTGKTRTLTAKIAWLIKNRKADPTQILALTFTNKAAKQLVQRLDTEIPGRGKQVTAATFHGFCLSLLKEYTGFDRSLMDDGLRKEMIQKARGKKGGRQAVSLADLLITLCKQQLLGPKDDLSSLVDSRGGPGMDAAELSRIYHAYTVACGVSGLADFEDLIFLAHSFLSENFKMLEGVKNRFAQIFVDEYQDLNFAQYELVRTLAKDNNITVIGDPDQSIYGFRGSDNRFFNQFEMDYPGCEKVWLNQNYRSTQTILDASFQVICPSGPEQGGRKKIYSSLDCDQKIIIHKTASDSAEAVAVGKMIEELMGGFSSFSLFARGAKGVTGAKEYSFSDFAVLYRTRKQMDAFVRVFEKEGIPFQAADREDLFAMDGIGQVISLFRAVMGRGSGFDIGVLASHCDPENKDRDAVVAGLIKKTWPRVAGRSSLACLNVLMEILGTAAVVEKNQEASFAHGKLLVLARLYPVPMDFLDHLALKKDPDCLSENAEKVSLMTMHAAKGLEFPVVFVAGCEQGLIPFARDGKICDDPEEERRLFYVAMTRAMDILCLTYAMKRRIYGENKEQKPSVFIKDIEDELAQIQGQDCKTGSEQARAVTEIQLELF